jgi:hypothetical protein
MLRSLELGDTGTNTLAETDQLLKYFPKRRPDLPEQYELLYADYYRDNRDGRGVARLSRWLESWMHRKVAQDVCQAEVRVPRKCETLEIGAGTLNHTDFEPDSGPYDIVEPMTVLYEGNQRLGRVRSRYVDTRDIPLTAGYDRIVSVATFEHICDLPAVVARTGLLLRSGGKLRIGIPSEGTLLWSVGWRITTGLEFRLRRGLSYGTIMRHEHVNDASEIAGVVSHFYADVDRVCFGLHSNLSLYQYLECSAPQTDRCKAYLGEAAMLP